MAIREGHGTFGGLLSSSDSSGSLLEAEAGV